MNTTVKMQVFMGTIPVGVCGACDLYDQHGRLLKHVDQYELFACQNPGCPSMFCRAHLESCGFCTACCAEEHGLGSHNRGETP